MTLNQAAPAGGYGRADEHQPSLTVPASVTVAAAATTATFSATAGTFATNQCATVTATSAAVPQPVTISLWRRRWCRASLQSDESGAERYEQLHGDADPGRSGGRQYGHADQHQPFAHRTGIGDGSGGGDSATFNATAGTSRAIRPQP